MQELLLLPLVMIRFGIEAKFCSETMWSENVLLALLLTQQPIPRYGRGTGLLSPLLQLLQVLLLLVETQPPIVTKTDLQVIWLSRKSGEAERAFYIVYDLKTTIQRIVLVKASTCRSDQIPACDVTK